MNSYQNNKFILVCNYNNNLSFINRWLFVEDIDNYINIVSIRDLDFCINLDNNEILHFYLFSIKNPNKNIYYYFQDIQKYLQNEIPIKYNIKFIDEIKYEINDKNKTQENNKIKLSLNYRKIPILNKWFISHPKISIDKFFLND